MTERDPFFYKYEEYGIDSENDDGVGQLYKVLLCLKGVEPRVSWIKGLRILDLGCGSSSAFPPHFARVASRLGASVTGIDINCQSLSDYELFEVIRVDLVKAVLNGGLHELPQLKGRQFDIISSWNFVGCNPDPHLLEQLDKVANIGVEKRLFELLLLGQCYELLAKNGIILLNQTDRKHREMFYKHINGEITPFFYDEVERSFTISQNFHLTTRPRSEKEVV